ncbi:thyroid receptor-interacting protein 6 [Venturia canescens]|uniref:thyroid receptor-interacting protein 6 n=1 Tax=Venturia canescens TaxID=32260 RepID=UPI001C9C0DC3|nr:thyroid receptor-interacting protein 6 [Venturia canescens]XP_043278758.1 thyroid receptor-interacting protein 6 [Venturia canescens]XP_043278759.1 thyroid receptor-interacting protein 6 [Venturia canescens]XP_043278760.1 thyroid receptor-interacting protein 6 [Venturia canescens]XP_043278761.1 thyroid receptor-interacting protein 6 [Venturia canescens]
MAATRNLEKQIADLQINNPSDSSNNEMKIGKKIGPAVPPKPKKSQPEVPQSYTIKAPSLPSYSTLLDNSGTNKTPINLYTNSPSPYVPSGGSLKNENPHSSNVPLKNGCENSKFYNSNETFYTNEPHDGFAMKYDYDDKHFYSNIQQKQMGNIPSLQDLHDQRSKRPINNAVYSNVEPTPPILQPALVNNGKDLIYSNIQWNRKSENTYSNIPATDNNEDLPPPPEPAEYTVGVTGNTFPPPPEELPPPPSPVSSSYSELRRATYQSDDLSKSYPSDIYGPDSQSSSTYESIYEPINPRPSSQLSCNYSIYSGYGSATSTQPQSKISPVKEVDALTDLLVQGMEDAQEESDIYGICAHCDEKVEGEGNGCSAMDKVFHIKCFCCFVCKVNLQGKSFYSLEAKPYCEEDYLNTLEKCSVCARPILDRILRATGKPYHPSCFTCVLCGQSLDGIPFTVDATNQIHCIQCFNKKFAPRCCVCKLPIMPEPGQDETVRVVALDRSFHTHCYKCEDCGLVLSSDSEGHRCYPLDDHVLCKSCNATRVQTLTSHMTTEL